LVWRAIRAPLRRHSELAAAARPLRLLDFRLERNQRPQSDQAMAVKLIRALLAGRAAGDVIELQGG
jgi:hypothetical protein